MGPTAEFGPFHADQRDAVRAPIQLWDDLIAPKFVQKNGRGADITYLTNNVNFVAGDIDGDGVADFVVNLGSAHLTASDLYL